MERLQFNIDGKWVDFDGKTVYCHACKAANCRRPTDEAGDHHELRTVGAISANGVPKMFDNTGPPVNQKAAAREAMLDSVEFHLSMSLRLLSAMREMS